MQDAFMDLEKLLGYEGVEKLAYAKIAVFGLGSVGSYVAEALTRCGVGSLTLIDYGEITENEMNRHLYTLRSTVGKSKVQTAKERIHAIDADILVHTYETFYGEDTATLFDLKSYDYIVDTMGDLNAKLLLIEQAKQCKVPILSCMDTSNKINPGRFEITDISRTSVCPVAKSIRTNLRKKGIHKVKVLFSKERIRKKEQPEGGGIIYASGIAGFMIAGEIVKDLLSVKNNKKV